MLRCPYYIFAGEWDSSQSAAQMPRSLSNQHQKRSGVEKVFKVNPQVVEGSGLPVLIANQIRACPPCQFRKQLIQHVLFNS